MANNSDQIRQLKNSIHLGGMLAELEQMKTGTKDGVNWLSFVGVVQCGDTPTSNVKFRTFVRETTSKGDPNKTYSNAKAWYEKAVSLAACGGDVTKATMFDGIGSLQDNIYWSDRKPGVVEDVQFNVNWFSPFKEYAAEITLEGYVVSLSDEYHKDDSSNTTGRQRMAILSRDSYGNILKLDRVIIPNTEVITGGVENMVQALSDYSVERGSTALFYVNLIPHISNTNRGGVGIVHGGGRSYVERTLVGFDNVGYDSEEKAISRELAKVMISERNAKIDQVEENKGSVTTSSSARTSVPAKKPVESSDAEEGFDIDDMPF